MASIAVSSSLLRRLAEGRPLVAVELRPPRTGLSTSESMDTWIDMYHSIQRLTRQDTLVFLTDNAVGQAEEENLSHLTSNLGEEVDRSKIVPFLTCKHTIDYCQMYAKRAASYGFEALTVLGGDTAMGPPRCVPHAFELRRIVRRHVPSLVLGGWANPHADPVKQVDYLLQEDFAAEFYLTQIVSHHDIPAVERFLSECARRGVTTPGVFGVFCYRSANPKTLRVLNEFFPVPTDGITRDFGDGASPEEICARSVLALRDLGVTSVYLSNLGFKRVDARYRKILNGL